MSKKVNLSEQAFEDIQRLEDFIRGFDTSGNTLQKFRRELKIAISMLSKAPEIGVKQDKSEERRKYVHYKYIYLYFNLEEEVYITNVFSEHEDWINEI